MLTLGHFKPSYLLLSCPTPPLKSSSPINFPTCTDGLLFVAVDVGSAAVVGLLIVTNLCLPMGTVRATGTQILPKSEGNIVLTCLLPT